MPPYDSLTKYSRMFVVVNYQFIYNLNGYAKFTFYTTTTSSDS